MSNIKINVYRDGGEWFGARWVDGEYDGCDELPCAADASEQEAIAVASLMPLNHAGPREVNRVQDVTDRWHSEQW